jgi:DNA excision repair protein ERCC-4
VYAGADVRTQALLVLHFPRLRLVWSRSLHATAEMFALLKANQDEPEPQTAAKVGVPTDQDESDLLFNETAVEVLRRLPGVTERCPPSHPTPPPDGYT